MKKVRRRPKTKPREESEEPDYLEEYRSKLRIDRDDIDTELENQAVCVEAVGRHKAFAQQDRDMDNEASKRVKAERADALRKKLGKVTVKELDETIEQDPDYRAARAQYKLSERILGEWEALVEAFRSRGFMLTSLTDSVLQQGFNPGHVREDRPTRKNRRDR